MPLYGYRLSGNAKSAASDFIPSLIGVTVDQSHPAGTDTYFEQIELPAEAQQITSMSLSRWVSYDSLPLQVRDPIITVKAGSLGFYIPMSELEEIMVELGNSDLIAMVNALKKARV